jgi:hypothetical protein
MTIEPLLKFNRATGIATLCATRVSDRSQIESTKIIIATWMIRFCRARRFYLKTLGSGGVYLSTDAGRKWTKLAAQVRRDSRADLDAEVSYLVSSRSTRKRYFVLVGLALFLPSRER